MIGGQDVIDEALLCSSFLTCSQPTARASNSEQRRSCGRHDVVNVASLGRENVDTRGLLLTLSFFPPNPSK